MISRIKLDDDSSRHKWNKVNLMTIVKKNTRPHDIWKCSVCGVEGKLYTLGTLEFESNVESKIDAFEKCSVFIESLDDEPWDIGNLVTLTNISLSASGASNLISGTTHKIISPPDEYKEKYPNYRNTVWVMGNDEPYRLLSGEFKFN